MGLQLTEDDDGRMVWSTIQGVSFAQKNKYDLAGVLDTTSCHCSNNIPGQLVRRLEPHYSNHLCSSRRLGRRMSPPADPSRVVCLSLEILVVEQEFT